MENLFRQNPIALALAVVAALLAAVIVAEAAIGFWPRAIDEASPASFHPSKATTRSGRRNCGWCSQRTVSTATTVPSDGPPLVGFVQ